MIEDVSATMCRNCSGADESYALVFGASKAQAAIRKGHGKTHRARFRVSTAAPAIELDAWRAAGSMSAAAAVPAASVTAPAIARLPAIGIGVGVGIGIANSPLPLVSHSAAAAAAAAALGPRRSPTSWLTVPGLEDGASRREPFEHTWR